MCSGCCFLTIALTAPRLGIGLLWIFTDYINRAFDNWVLPLLGFLFLPFTTLSYVVFFTPGGNLTPFEMAITIFAFLVDISAYFGGANKGREILG